MEKLDKQATTIPGKMEQDHTRLHKASQDGAQIKTHELFISKHFRLIFSDISGLWVNEIARTCNHR